MPSRPPSSIRHSPDKYNVPRNQNLTNFVTECDRFCVSDRVAAALASSLLKDFNITNSEGDVIVIDKNKIRRKRQINREMLVKNNCNIDYIKSFSFDSKKNRVLFSYKTDDNRLHPRLRSESDIVFLKHPGSIFLGYAVAPDTDKSPQISQIILNFFREKGLCLDKLVAIGCDGEPKNTGKNNGILRNLEIALKRPLHWFVCLLHLNELPFRHIFEKIDSSKTTGPKSSTGKLGKAIESVDKPVRFKIIMCYADKCFSF